MKLKLDLHTHCFEATYTPLPKLVTTQIVDKIVASVIDKGLDGIAITEHYTKEFGFVAKKIAFEHFGNKVTIIPGREIYWHGVHTVELFLPDGTTFRFLPHPIYIDKLKSDHFDFSQIHGIEVDNHSYDDLIDKPYIRSVADKHNLLLLSNSDAHSLADIGYHYNVVALDDLVHRAKL